MPQALPRTSIDVQAYCLEKLKLSGSSFHYSFYFLTPEKRLAMIALYAFCREVDDIADTVSDPDVAKKKLQWWMEEIDRLYAGNPQHPITQALAVHLKKYPWDKENFMGILSGMVTDCERPVLTEVSALQNYSYQVASTVGLLSLEVFGYTNPASKDFAIELGYCLQLINIIRDVGEDIRRERVYLPAEDMNTFAVTYEMLEAKETHPNLAKLLRYQADKARAHYHTALSHLAEDDRLNQLAAIIMANIYLSLLDEIEGAGFNVLVERTSLTPLRKLILAWRVARSEKKRAKKWRKSKARSL